MDGGGRWGEGGEGGGGGDIFVSCKVVVRVGTIDRRISTVARRNMSGFHRPGRDRVHHARSAVRCSASHNKATGGPKRPLVPGFPVTLISRCFIGAVKDMAKLTRCAYNFGWFVA